MARYIGLMSGTSLDGVDAVLVDFDDDDGHGMRVHAHVHQPFDTTLREQLMALQAPAHDELHRSALAANAVALAYAACVDSLIARANVERSSIAALGAHGQTVRHRPREFDGCGYTVQLLNASLLAERSGIDVIADLRSRDIAAGGQGAPLVPAFHAWAFGGQETRTRAVLNLGGMANLSLLHAGGHVSGFDTGPGGALLDAWCLRQLGKAFDDGGRWAASGQVDAALLQAMLAHPFFARLPPKSTGRDAFHPAWVDGLVSARGPVEPVDVQATLAELTAASIADALLRHAPDATSLIACGGGARNEDLLARLRRRLPRVAVETSADHGIAVDEMEALAFAWLAHRFLRGQPGNVPSVTGASGPRRLGALHPAR
jgi:anhydro-N-acetylmuramic acid kinase